jgi:hypothetical protein
MKRKWVVTAMAVVTASVAAGPASGASGNEPNLNASCVGRFSEFHGQGGDDWHRSEIAKSYAKDAHPVGQNLYSQVAHFEPGSLEDCRAQL